MATHSVAEAIARHVSALIPDGANLQLGIGGIPDMVLKLLKGKKDLGIHTEMFSDGLLELIESGSLTAANNNLNPGKIVATFIMGSRKLYDWVDKNPLILMKPVDYTNSVLVASQVQKLVSINSAVEVNFHGEVAADTIGFKQFSGVGGQVDFVRSTGCLRRWLLCDRHALHCTQRYGVAHHTHLDPRRLCHHFPQRRAIRSHRVWMRELTRPFHPRTHRTAHFHRSSQLPRTTARAGCGTGIPAKLRTTMKPVYIVSARRTAIGTFGGSLKDVTAVELGKVVVEAALADANIPADAVSEAIFGNVLGAGQGQNIARQVALAAGLPVPAFTINKVCGSGLKAIQLAWQAIALGDAEIVVAGGTENMNQAPYVMPKDVRFGGLRMGNATLVDTMIKDGLWCASNDYHMGITAENLAKQYGITREAQDAFALQSQQRAQAAIAGGLFKTEIAPVTIKDRKETRIFDTDEHPRATTAEPLPNCVLPLTQPAR